MAEPTAIVLGKFDGVHIGHQILIKKLLEQKEKGLKTVVFTFDKSPASLFIQDEGEYRELCTLEEKREIFENIGVDVFIEFPMNMETAKIPADEFVTEILQKQLKCNILIAGEDITFGYKGMGDSRMLLEYSQNNGFDVEILEKLMMRDVFLEDLSEDEISSTGIRKEINAGNVAKANVLMGRSFSINGEVIHGNHLGSTVLNMPTANVKWPENKVFPNFGVYLTEIVADNVCYKGITNVGLKPTIKETAAKDVLAESYLFDYTGDLYGKNIIIRFLEFCRPEKTFDGLEHLKEQLKKDLQVAQTYWSQR
jgi:riboflavin kinase/FMN adenylyltransferase